MGIGTLSLTILPVAAMVSCSSTETPISIYKGELTPVEFDVSVLSFESKPEANVIYEYFNPNTCKALIDKFLNLTAVEIQ